MKITSEKPQRYLTGVVNRLAIEEDISNKLARNRQYKRLFSIVMADIDHFKNVMKPMVTQQEMRFSRPLQSSCRRPCERSMSFIGSEEKGF